VQPHRVLSSGWPSRAHRRPRPRNQGDDVRLSYRTNREGSHWRWRIFWNDTVILQGLAASHAEAVASVRGLSYSLGGTPRTPLICGEERRKSDDFAVIGVIAGRGDGNYGCGSGNLSSSVGVFKEQEFAYSSSWVAPPRFGGASLCGCCFGCVRSHRAGGAIVRSEWPTPPLL
jgi:hypothetical protein